MKMCLKSFPISRLINQHWINNSMLFQKPKVCPIQRTINHIDSTRPSGYICVQTGLVRAKNAKNEKLPKINLEKMKMNLKSFPISRLINQHWINNSIIFQKPKVCPIQRTSRHINIGSKSVGISSGTPLTKWSKIEQNPGFSSFDFWHPKIEFKPQILFFVFIIRSVHLQPPRKKSYRLTHICPTWF